MSVVFICVQLCSQDFNKALLSVISNYEILYTSLCVYGRAPVPLCVFVFNTHCVLTAHVYRSCSRSSCFRSCVAWLTAIAGKFSTETLNLRTCLSMTEGSSSWQTLVSEPTGCYCSTIQDHVSFFFSSRQIFKTTHDACVLSRT